MKIVIDISDLKGCADCPYRHYRDDGYDEYRDEIMPVGFYCGKSRRFLASEAEYFNNGGCIAVPEWCEFKEGSETLKSK